MIIRLPRHPNYLSQDPESISRTFLEQFALVSVKVETIPLWLVSETLDETFYTFSGTYKLVACRLQAVGRACKTPDLLDEKESWSCITTVYV